MRLLLHGGQNRLDLARNTRGHRREQLAELSEIPLEVGRLRGIPRTATADNHGSSRHPLLETRDRGGELLKVFAKSRRHHGGVSRVGVTIAFPFDGGQHRLELPADPLTDPGHLLAQILEVARETGQILVGCQHATRNLLLETRHRHGELLEIFGKKRRRPVGVGSSDLSTGGE